MDCEELIIIGGGPCGYTAALYAARARLNPFCIEGFEAGGQLLLTTDVENYPGFPEGVLGPDLTTKFREQAEHFGARFLMRDVTRVDFSRRPFRVYVGEDEHRARAVIVATGARPRTLGLASEHALQNHGVAYCSVCDGPFFTGKRVVVVGGGDAALEEAIGLTKFTGDVVVVHRRTELRASRIMQDYARANDSIELLVPYVVEEALGVEEGRLTGVRLRNVESGEERVELAAGMFVSIGHDPNTEIFRGCLDHDAHGYLRVEPGTTRTSIEGVFAAGDVQDRVYRQAVTSAGAGCMAAIDAERWLSHQAPRTAGTPLERAA